MRKLAQAALVVAVVGLVVAPAASAKERLLTLYSPKIDSLPYVHDTHQVTLKAGVGRPRQAGLHPRLQGDGAGRLQGPEGQAPPDREDDGAPLPLLRSRPRGRGARQLLARRRLHRRPRRGTPARAPAAHASEELARQVRHRQPQVRRRRARLVPHRDGDEPLQAPEELLRAHQGLVHDRAADLGPAGRDRQLRPARQRHVLRRAGRRQEGLQLRATRATGRRPSAGG